MTLSIDPARTALLSMDFQNAHMGRIADADGLIARQAATIAAARAARVSIAHVRVAFAPGERLAGQMAKRITPDHLAHYRLDAPAAQFHADLAPADGDIVVRKTRVGAFSTTDLDDQLRARGVDCLIITGISTSGVVLSTVRDAHDRDYELIVVSDLVADPDHSTHALLVEKVLAHQSTVVDSAELIGALAD